MAPYLLSLMVGNSLYVVTTGRVVPVVVGTKDSTGPLGEATSGPSAMLTSTAVGPAGGDGVCLSILTSASVSSASDGTVSSDMI